MYTWHYIQNKYTYCKFLCFARHRHSALLNGLYDNRTVRRQSHPVTAVRYSCTVTNQVLLWWVSSMLALPKVGDAEMLQEGTMVTFQQRGPL